MCELTKSKRKIDTSNLGWTKYPFSAFIHHAWISYWLKLEENGYKRPQWY
jgi:hypothetical protein